MRTWLLSALLISFSSAAALAGHSIFDGIPDKAQVANGSAEIKTYNHADKKDLEADGAAALKKEYWKNCGPWKTVTGRRDAIKLVSKLETMGDKTDVGDILQKLYDDGKIVAVAGAISNTEVECSLSWFNFYGSDGTMLELRYNEGD